MLSAILRRIFSTVPTLIFLTLVLFCMIKLIPGDEASMLLGQHATPEALAAMQKDLGLDLPVWQQYFRYMSHLVFELDLGVSFHTREPVFEIVLQKFPATIELATAAMIFAIVIGVPLGILAASKSGSIWDFSAMSFAVTGVSMPVFWLGLVLVWTVSLQWQLLPLSGRLGIEFDYDPTTGFLLWDSFWQDSEIFWSGVKHLILPAITLGTIPMAFIARMTRTSMIDVLSQDYMRTAKAKGCFGLRYLFKHAFRNAGIPVATVTGIQFGTLLAGAMITETIYSWPGMGTWILTSVNARDTPAIEGGVIVIATSFMVINLLVDLLYAIIDPRMRST